jgi:hypothetical protein
MQASAQTAAHAQTHARLAPSLHKRRESKAKSKIRFASIQEKRDGLVSKGKVVSYFLITN